MREQRASWARLYFSVSFPSLAGLAFQFHRDAAGVRYEGTCRAGAGRARRLLSYAPSGGAGRKTGPGA